MSPSPVPDRCTVTVVAGAEGHAEVHKRATSARASERLAREAVALRLARHPGVVELLDLRTEDDGTNVLVTRLAGTHTLATWTSPGLDEAAGVLVALAETLADLHHLGIAHGAVEAEHVVLDPTGRPVLCGFDRSPAHRPTDDVVALGRLARRLVDPDPTTVDDPGRPVRREARRHAVGRRRLADLADQATAEDEVARPGARRFAAAVVAAVPSAVIAAPADPAGARSQPERPGADRPNPVRPMLHPRARSTATDRGADVGHDPVATSPGAGRARRGAPTAVLILGLACLVFGVLSAWHGERPELAATSGAAPAPTTPTGVDAAGADPTAPDPAGASRCGSAPTGCTIIRPGGVIEHGGARYALGEATDELVVATTACPDPPAAALLRDDGATYLFDRWATTGRDVAPTAGPAVPAGSHWEPQPLDERGCAPLAVLTPDGSVRPVDPAAAGTEPLPVTGTDDPATASGADP